VEIAFVRVFRGITFEILSLGHFEKEAILLVLRLFSRSHFFKYAQSAERIA
jgi:hypothetical protein